MKLKRASAQGSASEPSERAQRVAEHLSAAVRIPTVAPDGPREMTEDESATFAALHALLRETYPAVFAACELDHVGRAGLLMRLPGETAERPLMLMAHQDVVPVPQDWQAEGWEHPPFDGVIADGRVHGRGTLDDKGALVVMLEALEELLAGGWSPARDVWLLMGGDEEQHGASAVAAVDLLRERGVEPWMVLDEGGAVASEAFPGLKQPMAVVGASEKGIATLSLTVEGLGGHASTPPRQSAPGILARALAAVEDNPFPVSLHDVSVEMFEGVAPQLRGPMRAVLGRAGRLRGPLARVLPRLGPEMAAMVRTTAAITMLEGSPAQNVLATRATATLNCRIAVGSTVVATIAHLEQAIGDERVQVDVVESSEPSPVSPTGLDPRWLAIGDAVEASYPGTVTVPYVMMAASDARHVAAIAPAVYRFSPLAMDKKQREAIHGPNEYVEIASLERGVDFYRALLTGSALGPAGLATDCSRRRAVP
ncbi:M20/M25/M40 family metallo-hydrolase [Demequina globuliformis]|uniref:M20/M25/M40 family metallo-hydrolase n=1 Tax=Demequina globuliformis TaxID=676202 RepID=UPI000AEBF5D4|nr:M20/M25/M40 family metallo-hydrolase [Demequina globuliformis]